MEYVIANDATPAQLDLLVGPVTETCCQASAPGVPVADETVDSSGIVVTLSIWEVRVLERSMRRRCTSSDVSSYEMVVWRSLIDLLIVRYLAPLP
jgi:hypothetical protein